MMPQLRLTAKMAKELKVNMLNIPSVVTELYDDWYLDVTRILRKKVFIFMHIRTRIALAMPSYEIGGVQNLLEFFPLLLRELLNVLGYERLADEAYSFFSCRELRINFVKTDDKSTLRYISEFKFLLQHKADRHDVINQILCDEMAKHCLNHLMKSNLDPKDYTTPLKLLKSLLKDK